MPPRSPYVSSMIDRAARWETVRLAGLPLVVSAVVVAALAVVDRPWLAVAAGVAIAVCLVACLTAFVAMDRTNRHAFAELRRPPTGTDRDDVRL